MGTERVDVVITQAAELVTARVGDGCARGAALDDLEVIADGALAMRDGTIVAVGTTAEIADRYVADRTIDADGRCVSPGLVDCHTHAVYAGSRHDEWERKVTGSATTNLGGGIRTTLASTRAATEEDLRAQARDDLDRMLAYGTTTAEIKSGYGQDVDTELRQLRVIAELDHQVDVVGTYLALHVLPDEYGDDPEAYLDLAVDLLPEARRYAGYVDVAVDPIAFTAEQCERLTAAARAQGLGIRVHADQTADADGTAFAVRHGAASVDHLDEINTAGLAALAASDTVGVLFPGVTLHMLETTPEASPEAQPPRSNRPVWARQLVKSGAALALSTDFNPGTSPTRSMQLVMQLAARLYRLSYAEIWHMSTINPAVSLDRGGVTGSLEPGKRADVVIWDVPEHGMVIHQFGTNLADTVIAAGEVVVEGGQPIR